jgi:pilus assembly protein CpaE
MKTQSGFDSRHIAPVPRISLEAFCESEAIVGVIAAAARDRRMERAHVTLHRGGPGAAVSAFRDAATPDVIVLDTAASRHDLLSRLEALADFCDAGTKVVVIGRTNDFLLYRELMARGVSEYLVAPPDVIEFIRTIAGAPPVGKILAVTGCQSCVWFFVTPRSASLVP